MVAFGLVLLAARKLRDWGILAVLSALIYWPAKRWTAGTLLGGDLLTYRGGRGWWLAPSGALLIAIGIAGIVMILSRYVIRTQNAGRQ